jgi:hypothetical protein
MENEIAIASAFIGFASLVVLILGITSISFNVFGGNVTNDTTTVRVYVWNTEPYLTKVEVSPSTITLEAGNTTNVNCTGHVYDWNGWQDIIIYNATFYNINKSSNSPDDKNNHYTNNTGTCAQVDGSTTNVTCTVSFGVWYFADNGTWVCNMTIGDRGVNISDTLRNVTFNRSNSGTATLEQLLAFSIPNEIDYGNLSVTETSSAIGANVSNWGNVPINISVRGWGGSSPQIDGNTSLNMICDYGNISVGQQRFAINNSVGWENMTNVTGTWGPISRFELPARTEEDNYGNDTNTTYWKLKVPLSVGGYCNGTVEFMAVDATNNWAGY